MNLIKRLIPFMLVLMVIGCGEPLRSLRIRNHVVRPTVSFLRGSGVVVSVKWVSWKLNKIEILTAAHILWKIEFVPFRPMTGVIVRPHAVPPITRKLQTRLVVEFYDFDLFGQPQPVYIASAKVIGQDFVNDLALLEAIVPRGKARAAVVPFMRPWMRMGQRLSKCGFSGSSSMPGYNEGVFCRWDLTHEKSKRTRGVYSGGISFGDSGGGIFDEQGRLIGIISSIVGIMDLNWPRSTPAWHMGIFIFVDEKIIQDLRGKGV